jgi:hypothetical protein
LGLAFLAFCLPEIHLAHAGHDGGHSMRSSRPTFTRGSGGSGPLQMTKGSTGSTSSTTSRNQYSSFLRDEYEKIQEQVAQGNGLNLEIIARYNGCEDYLTDAMKFELNAHYKVLFYVEDSQIKLEAEINKLIGDNEQLRDGCYPLIGSET